SPSAVRRPCSWAAKGPRRPAPYPHSSRRSKMTRNRPCERRRPKPWAASGCPPGPPCRCCWPHSRTATRLSARRPPRRWPTSMLTLFAAALAVSSSPGRADDPKAAPKADSKAAPKDDAKTAPKGDGKSAPKGDAKAPDKEAPKLTEGSIRFRIQEIDTQLKVGY